MHLEPIERCNELTRDEFTRRYLQPGRPVILTSVAHDWPATRKWTFDYLRDRHGDLQVPIVDPDYHKAGRHYMRSRFTMRFGDYLNMVQHAPTDRRIFLWNIFEHARELVDDVRNPTLCDGWIDNFPFMFFGGAGAITALHYDIDRSHVFHTHFHGRKRVMLFDQMQSALLYQHPFTVHSHVNPLQPDFARFPALRHARGYEATLQHGETLFIPSLYWHAIQYLDGGFAISLRARTSLWNYARGLMNIARHGGIDLTMNALLKSKWKQWKEQRAAVIAQRALPIRGG